MKKVLMFLFATLMVAGGLLFVNKTKAETEIQDQFCAAGTEFETLGNNGVSSQTFVPTKNRLSYINLKIGGIGLNGTTAVTLTVLESFNGAVIGSKAVSPNMTEAGIRQWVFATPLTLDTSKTYQIKLEESGTATVYWYYGVGDQTCDGNNRTYGFRDSTRQTWDFNYGTFGYTYTAPPANENTNSSNTNTNAVANSNTNSATIPTGQSAGSGAVPATATSTSIKAASGLTALYSSNAANLAWTASTTADIDGYKIFRSEAKTTGFIEIGKTVKAIVQYIDTKDLTAGKTYYYFVRAYKTTAESASTATVSLLIPANAVATTNTNTNKSITPISASITDNTDYKTIELYWILGGVISVLIVLLAAYEIEKKKKGAFVGAKHFRLLK